MILKPHNHKIDESRTGRQIATDILKRFVDDDKAIEIIAAFDSSPAPIGIFQKGHLRYFMDAAQASLQNGSTADNPKASAAIQTIINELDSVPEADPADEILRFCRNSDDASIPPLTAFENAREKFPGLLGFAPMWTEGQSVEFKVRDKCFMFYDETTQKWERRDSRTIAC